MPSLYIGEYCDIGSTSRGSIPIPLDPPLFEQSIDIGAQSKQSAVLAPDTCIVKLVSDADCAIAIGADPDASSSVRYLASGKEQILTVLPNTKLKIAVVASGGGSMSDSLGAFLKVVASPAEAQKALDALSKQAAVIDGSASALRSATDDHKKAKADLDSSTKMAQAAKAVADKAADDIAKAQAALAAAQAAYDAQVKADAADANAKAKALADREAVLNGQAADLDARARDLADAASNLEAREKALADKAAVLAASQADYDARIAKLKALTA
jgi:chromosome segregation ATPase